MKKWIALPVAIILIGIVFLFAFANKNTANKEIHYRDKAIVLMYHHVDTAFEEGKSTSGTMMVDQFREHMQALKDHHYEVITMQQFLDFKINNKSIPDNAVVLTFDDGYESFYTYVFPIMKEFGMTATNFIIGYTSDLYNPDAYPHLNWEQMEELKQHDMGIYSHTYNLHVFAPISVDGKTGPALSNPIYLQSRERMETNEEFRKRIGSDLAFMNKRIDDELGVQPKLLAFPFGAFNEEVISVGAELGIELFFTIEEGINTRESREVFRINAGEPNIPASLLIEKLAKYKDPS